MQKRHQLQRGRIHKSWHPSVLTRLRDRAGQICEDDIQVPGVGEQIRSCTSKVGTWEVSTLVTTLSQILLSFIDNARECG